MIYLLSFINILSKLHDLSSVGIAVAQVLEVKAERLRMAKMMQVTWPSKRVLFLRHTHTWNGYDTWMCIYRDIRMIWIIWMIWIIYIYIYMDNGYEWI